MARSKKISLFLVAALILACILFLLLFAQLSRDQAAQTFNPTVAVTATTTATVPVLSSATTIPDKKSQAEKTLMDLQNAVIPSVDLTDVTGRVNGHTVVTGTNTDKVETFKVGDQHDFWVVNPDNSNRQVSATLEYQSKEIDFWIENGISFEFDDLQTLAETFSNEIYPSNHQFFGTEDQPGIDQDDHLFVLYVRGLKNSIAGYTSFIDHLPREVHPYSNEHELFVLNADVLTLAAPYTLSVMSHEFQHLIHQNKDPNEELWLNESLSELSKELNGYEVGGFYTYFLRNPDMQLNDWAYGDEDNKPHYGASYLFMSYLVDRFGDELISALVADPLNGLESIDSLFQALEMKDSQNGETYTADHLFADWTAANYLQDDSIGDGRFAYLDHLGLPQAAPTIMITNCDPQTASQSVSQYGTDYIEIQCGPESVFTFQGQEFVNVLPLNISDGGSVMWSNIANASDTAMTQEFDFSGIHGEITAMFDLWFDLEVDYDFGYLMVSENGKDWQILESPGCKTENIAGNNLGCGYNGSSDGWLSESVDLSAYSGKKVYLRFEVITDGAVLGEGLAVDHFSIPAIGYIASFDESTDGWVTDGFVRMDNQIPQSFLVSVIDQGTETTVTEYQVQPGGTLKIPIRVTNPLHPVTIAVSGSSRFTRQQANYRYSIDPK